ncbi:MAG: MBL fold metallo-hydrolase [Kiritimatiellae bacterium]|nr:MBL fold metallo-hydrolase [Kiritimatiellia bacterium]
MRYEIMPVGVYGANCVILWDDPACAWVVDPGARGAAILGRMRNLSLRPGVVVLTHAHFDHISAVNEIVAEFSVPVYLHAADEAIAFSPLNAMPPYPATSRPSTLVTDKAEGDTLAYGGLEARILHTPGHTPGGWCLLFEKDGLLVAGDTLFAGSVGRTDFPGGDGRQLAESLKKLTALPGETQVICGHGSMTTIEREIRDNPYL